MEVNIRKIKQGGGKEGDPHRATDAEPLLDTDLTRVRSVPGVKWAVPLYLRQTQARLSDGRLGPARVYGLDTATLLGRPARMIEGDSAELHTPDSVIVGKAQSERLGSPKVGDVFEINDRLARVVGIADAPRDFQGNPFIFTTYDRALQYTPLQRKQLNIVLMGDLHRQDGIFGMDRSTSFKVMICPWNNKRGN